MILDLDMVLNKLADWSASKVAGGADAITKTWKFKNFTEAFACMTSIALEAEKADHHPEWSNVYNTLTITLSTHDAGGLTEKDLYLAQKIDDIAGKYLV